MTASPVHAFRSVRERTVLLGRLVSLPHTVFALPFAFAGVLLAWNAYRPSLGWGTLFWVMVAMVAARTAAMAFNRLADRRIDAANPRTRNRELPRGAVSVASVVIMVFVSSALFLLAAGMLNRLCLQLAPVALAVILAYSYTKRFTWGSHFVLGVGLGIAPVGGWVAVTGALDAAPCLLGLAVMTWIAGMDMIYALQDEVFDRAQALHSIPARFGRAGALRIAMASHLVTVVALALLFLLLDLSPAYLLGVGVCGLILVHEHRVVHGHGLKRIQFAFFDMNGLFSLAYFAAVVAGVFL